MCITAVKWRALYEMGRRGKCVQMLVQAHFYCSWNCYEFFCLFSERLLLYLIEICGFKSGSMWWVGAQTTVFVRMYECVCACVRVKREKARFDLSLCTP